MVIIYHDLQGFIHVRWWSLDFWTISSMILSVMISLALSSEFKDFRNPLPLVVSKSLKCLSKPIANPGVHFPLATTLPIWTWCWLSLDTSKFMFKDTFVYILYIYIIWNLLENILYPSPLPDKKKSNFLDFLEFMMFVCFSKKSGDTCTLPFNA